MTCRKPWVWTIALSLAGIIAGSFTADAGFRRLRSDYEPGEQIFARSHFGNGSVAGVVRPARYGWEVRLPRGTWVGCRRSCEETLRVSTVDVFEYQDGTARGYGTLANECGVFGCLRIGF